MKIKETILLVVVGLGVVLLSVGAHRVHQFNEEKGIPKDVENFFTHNEFWNPIIKFFGGSPQQTALGYDLSGCIMIALGIVLVVGGTSYLVWQRR